MNDNGRRNVSFGPRSPPENIRMTQPTPLTLSSNARQPWTSASPGDSTDRGRPPSYGTSEARDRSRPLPRPMVPFEPIPELSPTRHSEPNNLRHEYRPSTAPLLETSSFSSEAQGRTRLWHGPYQVANPSHTATNEKSRRSRRQNDSRPTETPVEDLPTTFVSTLARNLRKDLATCIALTEASADRILAFKLRFQEKPIQQQRSKRPDTTHHQPSLASMERQSERQTADPASDSVVAVQGQGHDRKPCQQRASGGTIGSVDSAYDGSSSHACQKEGERGMDFPPRPSPPSSETTHVENSNAAGGDKGSEQLSKGDKLTKTEPGERDLDRERQNEDTRVHSTARPPKLSRNESSNEEESEWVEQPQAEPITPSVPPQTVSYPRSGQAYLQLRRRSSLRNSRPSSRIMRKSPLGNNQAYPPSLIPRRQVSTNKAETALPPSQSKVVSENLASVKAAVPSETARIENQDQLRLLHREIAKRRISTLLNAINPRTSRTVCELVAGQITSYLYFVEDSQLLSWTMKTLFHRRDAPAQQWHWICHALKDFHPPNASSTNFSDKLANPTRLAILLHLGFPDKLPPAPSTAKEERPASAGSGRKRPLGLMRRGNKTPKAPSAESSTKSDAPDGAPATLVHRRAEHCLTLNMLIAISNLCVYKVFQTDMVRRLLALFTLGDIDNAFVPVEAEIKLLKEYLDDYLYPQASLVRSRLNGFDPILFVEEMLSSFEVVKHRMAGHDATPSAQKISGNSSGPEQTRASGVTLTPNGGIGGMPKNATTSADSTRPQHAQLKEKDKAISPIEGAAANVPERRGIERSRSFSMSRGIPFKGVDEGSRPSTGTSTRTLPLTRDRPGIGPAGPIVPTSGAKKHAQETAASRKKEAKGNMIQVLDEINWMEKRNERP